MLKKTAAALAVAGVIALGSATPAFAYPVTPIAGCTVTPASFTAGVPSTIACVGLPAGPTTFTVVGPGVTPGVIASIASASASASVVKEAGADGTAAATFTPPQTAAYTITVVDAEGTSLFSETVPAASGTGTGGSASGGGLAVTGGLLSAEMAWLGIGIIGVGGIAVTAAVARRRAEAAQS